jgi:S-DNA-T family DNA segregation ATPase FtsK/SpoIIIE
MWSWLQKLMSFFQGEDEQRQEDRGRSPINPAPRQLQAKTKSIYPRERDYNRSVDEPRTNKERQFRFPVVPDNYPQQNRKDNGQNAEPAKPTREQGAPQPRERSIHLPKQETRAETMVPVQPARNSETTRRQVEKPMEPPFRTQPNENEKRTYQPSEVVSPVYGKITPATREEEHRIHTTSGIVYPRLEQEEHLNQLKQWEQLQKQMDEGRSNADQPLSIQEAAEEVAVSTAWVVPVETAVVGEREAEPAPQDDEVMVESSEASEIEATAAAPAHAHAHAIVLDDAEAGVEAQVTGADPDSIDAVTMVETSSDVVVAEGTVVESGAADIEVESGVVETSTADITAEDSTEGTLDDAMVVEDTVVGTYADAIVVEDSVAGTGADANMAEDLEQNANPDSDAEVLSEATFAEQSPTPFAETIQEEESAAVLSHIEEELDREAADAILSQEQDEAEDLGKYAGIFSQAQPSAEQESETDPVEADSQEPVQPEAAAQASYTRDLARLLERAEADQQMETHVEVTELPNPAHSQAAPVDPSAPTESDAPAVASVPTMQQPLAEAEAKAVTQQAETPYFTPALDLLNPSPQPSDDDDEHTQLQKLLLEETLSNFNVSAQVVGIVKGPSVTRFELQPAPGVKVNKITGLVDDIKLNLAAKDIRIEAPIPGRNAIGIEVPNLSSRPVLIHKILSSEKFQEHSSPLAVALGMDIGGEPIIADIKKMPHGLIAGSTGSGKSVCINSIIVSLLYKATPEQVRLLLIDPKMVELAPYNHLPHLVTPVVTEAKQATAALKWAVEEMEKRYALFVDAGVRDIDRYNQTTDDTLSYIVIVIDELADLMMVSPQDVEECIIRIAQKARACGIHLLLATQRPSVDVITGNIKANVPTRLAFAVFSQVDSRTILDQSGAERLLGRGDMLFLESGTTPVRLQGNFVSDDEIERITQVIKKQRKPSYIFSKEDLEQQVQSFDAGDDPLYLEALVFVAEQGQASASGLQRRFRVGYNRAARLIEMMEADGYVAGQSGGKARAVLISREDAQAVVEGSTLV